MRIASLLERSARRAAPKRQRRPDPRRRRRQLPGWLAAINGAQRSIHLEMYIVHNDVIGRRFREALIERAKAGVAVRVLYDWFGSLRRRRFGSGPRSAPPVARCASSTPRASKPSSACRAAITGSCWSSMATWPFISGLCIGDDWVGNVERGVPPWRDTGVRIRGPAVADAEEAFARAWAAWGPALPDPVTDACGDVKPQGEVDVRVIPTSPDRPTLYRLELAMIGVAEHRIWLTDAYFMGTSTYIESLSAAAGTVWTCGCCCPTTATSPGSATPRARCTGACSNPASASSSGTAR